MQFVNIEQSLSFSHTEERKALHFYKQKRKWRELGDTKYSLYYYLFYCNIISEYQEKCTNCALYITKKGKALISVLTKPTSKISGTRWFQNSV